MIGEVVRVDYNTVEGKRGRVACVDDEVVVPVAILSAFQLKELVLNAGPTISVKGNVVGDVVMGSTAIFSQCIFYNEPRVRSSNTPIEKFHSFAARKLQSVLAEILKYKYNWEDLLPCSIRKVKCSRLWRGISALWEEIYNSVCWNIRDGGSTDFWFDMWIVSERPLVNHYLGDGVTMSSTVATMVIVTRERVRRHLASSPCYPICQVGEETIEHILRDCPVNSNVWSQVFHPSKLLEFMSLLFDVWFMPNLLVQRRFAVNVVALLVIVKRQRVVSSEMNMKSGYLASLGTLGFARAFWRNSGALSGNALVDDTHDLLSREWDVVIRRISRDMNKVADALVFSLCDGSVGVLLFDSPLDFVEQVVIEDNQGADNVLVVG
ncbi:hypothetical protein V6N12_025503 [Hibiscus sabdariffa]|uniref:Reverse transcriptase zinc-binding domain-containing protein n=1 Tax=Hibiscus sabdariffa TaxID=183260 RepID=A0ABR2CJ59_9ROSI